MSSHLRPFLVIDRKESSPSSPLVPLTSLHFNMAYDPAVMQQLLAQQAMYGMHPGAFGGMGGGMPGGFGGAAPAGGAAPSAGPKVEEVD